jgi:hypothetical protein
VVAGIQQLAQARAEADAAAHQRATDLAALHAYGSEPAVLAGAFCLWLGLTVRRRWAGGRRYQALVADGCAVLGAALAGDDATSTPSSDLLALAAQVADAKRASEAIHALQTQEHTAAAATAATSLRQLEADLTARASEVAVLDARLRDAERSVAS